MAKVKISGVIVSPDYDDGWFEDWIAKGVITPSSRVVAAIEQTTEPIDLYINSYGGDVFAGGEMMIALLKAHAAGRIASVEVGSLAASMAANIVAALRANGANVVGNANTELMFHGCYTETLGGAQHHEDVAESLRNVNEAVIANLNRIGITECRSWFAEGREKWLAADECVKLGLLTSINDFTAEKPAEVKPVAARLAAFAANIMSRKEKHMKKEQKEPTAEVAETQTTETQPTETQPTETKPTTDEAAIEQRVQQLANERFAGLQAKHDKMISDLKDDIDSKAQSLAAVTTERDQLKAEVENLTASHAKEIEALRAQLAAEKSAHEAVVTGALRPAAKEANALTGRDRAIAALAARKNQQ